MSQLIIEQIAKHLDLPSSDVSTAFSDLIAQLKTELDQNQTASIPGLGSFKQTGQKLDFTPEDTLAMAVNNRYAALDVEMVQFGLEDADFVPASEELGQGNEQDIDQDVINQLIGDDLSGDSLFTDKQIDVPTEESADENLFLENDFSLLQPDDNTLDSTPITTDDSTPADLPVEPVSMKEEDPNSPNHSDQDPGNSDTEWSPFFEELEGEEFDIDNTIDLTADDWEADVPPPPSSPFAASSDSSNTNPDDLYFDVDADPDDTLFSSGSASLDVESPNYDNDLSWASAPMEDVTDFFEDDASASTAFSGDDSISSLSAEDEFFSPVSGSVNATPDDTLFSAEAIYEDESVEADDTIFLAPDQTVQQDMSSSTPDPYAPPKDLDKTLVEETPPPPAPPKERNPYAYREERKKSAASGSWLALAAVGALILLAGAAFWFDLLPFNLGGNGEPPVANNNTPAVVDPAPNNPTPAPATNPAADPSTDPVAANDPATTQTPPATTTQPTPPPVTQRIGIDRSKGGWTIVVTSKIQRAEATSVADEFAQKFQALRFPIDILTTNNLSETRHRVGIGQFASRQEATAILNKFQSDLPNDAWLLRIE